MEYPKQWDFLKGTFSAGQLGHAYIFSGSNTAEIFAFAKDFTKLVNQNIAGSDLAIEKGSYPDLLVIKSENSKSSLQDGEDRQEIDVALIRQAQNFLSYKSYYGGYKTLIIENAERLNTEAQNCFLKNLEEPKGDTLILLLSAKPQILLPTMLSRCQQIVFAKSAALEFSKAETAIMQDALTAINAGLAEKFAYAKSTAVNAAQVSKVLDMLQKYFRYLLLLNLGAQKTVPGIPLPQKPYSTGALKHILAVLEKISYTFFQYQVNPKLALEIALLEL